MESLCRWHAPKVPGCFHPQHKCCSCFSSFHPHRVKFLNELVGSQTKHPFYLAPEMAPVRHRSMFDLAPPGRPYNQRSQRLNVDGGQGCQDYLGIYGLYRSFHLYPKC